MQARRLAVDAATGGGAARLALAIAFSVLVSLALLAGIARADEARPYAASTGVRVAESAARAWSDDAALVYVENDEDVNATGHAGRWAYLYYSPATGRARVYSVREGTIVTAENLDMLFDAPALPERWIDSGQALVVAEEVAGRLFRETHDGTLSSMLLMRGAFHSGDPEQTTWTLVYTSPVAPPLFVVVDAIDGKVRRTWKG